jgi:hypothetical protein
MFRIGNFWREFSRETFFAKLSRGMSTFATTVGKAATFRKVFRMRHGAGN